MSDGPATFYLQWNAINWITVVVMAIAGFLVVGMIASGIRVYTKSGDAS